MIKGLDKHGASLHFDNRITICLGKDGQYSAMGIDVYFDNLTASLSGILLTERVARGHINIPLEDIPDLIKILKELYDNNRTD